MAKSVSTLLNEAGKLLEKTAAAEKTKASTDDVIKIAQQLREGTKQEHLDGLSDESLAVKIAHAFAIVDTVINLEELIKVAHFDAQAREAGYSEEKVAEYIEKKASPNFVSALSMVSWLNK
jgi:hypothetical protein